MKWHPSTKGRTGDGRNCRVSWVCAALAPGFSLTVYSQTYTPDQEANWYIFSVQQQRDSMKMSRLWGSTHSRRPRSTPISGATTRTRKPPPQRRISIGANWVSENIFPNVSISFHHPGPPECVLGLKFWNNRLRLGCDALDSMKVVSIKRLPAARPGWSELLSPQFHPLLSQIPEFSYLSLSRMLQGDPRYQIEGGESQCQQRSHI